MTTATGYITPNGTTRKFQAAATAALTIGPALIIIAQFLLTLLPVAVPGTVSSAVATIIEALTVLLAIWLTAPGAQDVVVPVEQPDVVPPVVPAAPVAPVAVYSAVPPTAPVAPRAQ